MEAEAPGYGIGEGLDDPAQFSRVDAKCRRALSVHCWRGPKA
jgi:hypothetical protein